MTQNNVGDEDLTAQQAADILNVSCTYLLQLLAEGVLSASVRVKMKDVLVYKEQRDKERKKSLDHLSQLSQDFGIDEDFPE